MTGAGGRAGAEPGTCRGTGTLLPLLSHFLANIETASDYGISFPLLSLGSALPQARSGFFPSEKGAVKAQGSCPCACSEGQTFYLWLQPGWKGQELCVLLNSRAAKAFPGAFDVPPVPLKGCQVSQQTQHWLLGLVSSNCCSTKDLNP